MSFPSPEYDVSSEATQVAEAMCEVADGHLIPTILEMYVQRRMDGKLEIADAELICGIRNALAKAEGRLEFERDAKRALYLIGGHGGKVE